MMAVTLLICFVMLSLASILAVFRLLVGPTILDRVIGFDMAATCIVGQIILASIHWGSGLFIEIMLIFSLLGFVGTISFVSYLNHNPDRIDFWRENRRQRRKEKDDS